MADRGRDLSFALLSDVSRFDTDKPARDLEQLGDAALDAGRNLDRLDDDTAKAGRGLDDLADDTKAAGKALDRLESDAKGVDLDRLATEAKAAAGDVDSAFERIAASSRANLKKVDTAADTAGDSVKDMSGEIRQEALEGAASFDGSMESMKDSAQSMAANALAAFGPLGAGIGVAASVGFGIWRAQSEKAKEAISAFTDKLIADGGRLSRESVLSKIEEFAADGSILDLKKQADTARIPVGDFISALAGDADALARSTEAIRRRKEELSASLEGTSDFTTDTLNMAKALDDGANALGDTAEQTAAAREAYDALAVAAGGSAEAIEANTEAQEAWSSSVSDAVDPLGTYQQLLDDKATKERETAEKTAAATKSQKDSWEDYAKDVDVSIAEVTAALEQQVADLASWSSNLATLAERGVDAGVLANLERMGPEAAPLIAKLTKATDDELVKFVALTQRQATLAAQAPASAFATQTPAATREAAAMRAAVANELGAGATIPVSLDGRYAMSDAERLRYDIANQIGTIVVPVRAGQSPYANTADNAKYRW
ncbi:hypothetical protein ACOCJ5_10290 [Knoellia sp. CPCC 206450]|uniref:hypothetical protein n=1 Tax=Knoellia tibetensis TaxID=3404798 RepID=UPI003B42E1B5